MTEKPPLPTEQSPDKDAESKAVEAFAERLKLREQYFSQVKVLYDSGILENLPVDPSQDRFTPEQGITGIDGKEYILPTYEDILQRLKDPEKRAMLEKKAEQGFTKMLIVPFAMPLSVLIERYKQVLLRINKEKGIKSTDGEDLELNENNPLNVWEDLIQCDNYEIDTAKQMEYGVRNYDGKTKEERRGQYKSELLKDPNNGWRLMLVEEEADIPAKGKGKAIAGRKRIEADLSPIDYLKLITQTEEQYRNEKGLTPEANLTLYLDYLQREQIVLDDFEGTGKSNWLAGNCISGLVPLFNWYRDGRLLNLNRVYPDYQCSNYGFRPSVEF